MRIHASALLLTMGLSAAGCLDESSTGTTGDVIVVTPDVVDAGAGDATADTGDASKPDVSVDAAPADTAPVDATPDAPVDVSQADAAPDAPVDIAPDVTSVACCFLDSHCGEGLTCAKALAMSTLGQCLSKPGAGSCWDDSECGLGEMCEGASFCPCGNDCAQAQVPGTCTPIAGCCSSDDDCTGDAVCAKSADQPYGRCMGIFDKDQCWSDAQCGAGQACVGQFFCPCWQLCGAPDIPGTCQDLPSACCTDDSGCPAGQVCEAVTQGLPGTCKPDPLGPECIGDAACCWTDDDCGGSSICKGASACGCLALCPTCGDCQPDQMGLCGSAEGTCCQWDGDCPEDWVCGDLGIGTNIGVCKPPTGEVGSCWSATQCEPGQVCGGAMICPCDADCDMEDAPGTCGPG